MFVYVKVKHSMAEDWNKPNVIVYTMYAITIYKLIRLVVPILLSKQILPVGQVPYEDV